MRTQRRKTVSVVVGFLVTTLAVAACGNTGDPPEDSSHDEVTVENCGENITFSAPAEDIFVNERAAVSHLFELDADEQIAAAAGLPSGSEEELKKIYGSERVGNLSIKSDEYMTVENVIAAQPDAVLAGYHWGYSMDDKLTPSSLLDNHGIPGYAISVSCRQESGDSQGIMPPWEAMSTDLENIGKLTGREDEAETVWSQVKERVDNLDSAPESDSELTVFSSSLIVDDGVLSGGELSADHAIIEAAGGQNVLADMQEARPTVSWETIAAKNPDVIIIVGSEDPGQYGYDTAVEDFKTNPATKELSAVKNERFVEVPMVATRGTPLMVDAAEHLRKALEEDELLPESSIEPRFQLDSK